MSRDLKIVLVISFVLMLACKKKEVGPQCPTCKEEVSIHTKEVVITCEGNFGWGNSSMSLYDPESKTGSNNVFQNINGYALGDVAQSVSEIDGKLYLVINNSGKIEVLDTATYQVITTITGLTSPRNICKVNNTNKAYVTDLYAGQIAILDLQTNQITGAVNSGGWSESMIVANGRVYVSRPDTNWVMVVNPVTDVIEDTIVLSTGPSGMVLDVNDNLWVLCNGGYQVTNPALYQVNPTTNVVINSMLFPDISSSPGKLSVNKGKDKIYYLNSGVFEMQITDNILPLVPIIDQGNAVFYGMGIDPNNNNIYVADAIDYVQPGWVSRYDSVGTLIDQFSVGIIPQDFWFK